MIRPFVIAAIALLCFAAPAAAGSTGEGISPPREVTVDTDSGALEFTYTWGLNCPQADCLIPTAIEVERNGSVVSSSPWQPDESNYKDASYTLDLDAAHWAAGDCFRLRFTAPSSDGVAGHVVASPFGPKVCAPAPTG